MKKNAQSSFEFTLVILLFVFVLSIFLVFLSSKMEEVEKQKNFVLLKSVGNIIESEMRLGSVVETGYYRNFSLPPTIYGKLYTVSYKNGSVLRSNFSVFKVKYVDPDVTKDEYVFTSYPNVTGTLNLDNDGENNITKSGAWICINKPSCP